MTKQPKIQKKRTIKTTGKPNNILEDLRELIEKTKMSIAATVNIGMTALYWKIGLRIRQEILSDERAEYGKSIVATLSRQLALEFGNGFSEKYLEK